MSRSDVTITFRGGCHCGGLQVEFSTRVDPADLAPRACDCLFCRKHGAAWVSDPTGRLRIAFAETQVLASYTQGSQAARFRLCVRCGVVVAVTYTHGDRVFGAVNAACLDGPDALASPTPASPQRLNPDEKIDRWLQLWIPDVELTAAGTGNPFV